MAADRQIRCYNGIHCVIGSIAAGISQFLEDEQSVLL